MKKVIDKKLYDTDTADKIAEWDNGHTSKRDFHYCSEDMYRTKKGSWFLYGEGGAASKYAESCGQNETCGGAAIVPLTPDEALEWLSGHGFADEAEKYFSSEIVEA
jgi:hypothetical protein